MSYVSIPPAKERGEWGELCFMARAAERGLRVTKPWGESAPHDFAIEHNGHFLRVQVKCTTKKRLRSYVCSVSSNRGPYSSDEDRFRRRVYHPHQHLVHPAARRLSSLL